MAGFMPLAVRRENDRIGMTVHRLENSETLVIAVNYSKDEQKTRYTLSHKTFKKALHGNVTDSTVTLAPYESAVFLVGE